MKVQYFCDSCTCKYWDPYIYKQKQPLRCSIKKKFTKFTEKHLWWSLYFNKFADLRPANLLKERHWGKYFSDYFAKYSRLLFLQNTAGWLLLFKGTVITIKNLVKRSNDYHKIYLTSYLTLYPLQVYFLYYNSRKYLEISKIEY